MADRQAPGWYQDPDDPTRLRHWSGRAWSGRSRSWPAWAISVADFTTDPVSVHGPVLEGPVRPAPQPAAAGQRSLVEGRNVKGLPTLRRSPTAPTRPGAGMVGTRPGPGGAIAAAWTPTRRPVMVVVALVGAAMLMLAATAVGVSRPAGQVSGPVGRDAAFVAQASSLCEAGLRPLRVSAAPTMTAPADGSSEASAAGQSAATVAAVGVHIRALDVAPDAVAAVQDWLGSWGSYVTDEGQLAAALAAPAGTSGARQPTSSLAGQLAVRVAADAHRADIFAGANGLTDCSLSPNISAEQPVTVP